MSRHLRATLVVAVLCAGPSIAGNNLPPEAVKAINHLKVDSRSGIEGSVKLLITNGSKEALEAVINFGAASRFTSNTLTAGKALATLPPAKVLSMLKKAARTNKKHPFRIARIVVMTEQIPGPAAQRVIGGYVKDNRAVVAAAAIRSLGARKEEVSRGALTAAVKSKRPTVAAAAAFALSQLKPNQATMELLFVRAQKAIKSRIGDSCAT